MSALRAEGVLHRRRVLICLRATNIELRRSNLRLGVLPRRLKMSTIFFGRLHDRSLVSRCPFRYSETVFYNFHVFYLQISSNWGTWVDDSSGRWFLRIFCKSVHEDVHGSLYGYGKSWSEMEFFFADSFSHQIVGFRHGLDLNECSQSNGTTFWSFERLMRTRSYFALTINH